MSDVNLQVVRECFELNLFRVLTNWQQGGVLLQSGEQCGQLFVENTSSGSEREIPFLLHPFDLPSISRAVVEVRAWHTDRFYPSVIEANPVLSQFVSEQSLALARDVFDNQPFSTILVLSELPATPEHRSRSLNLLQETGIDHVMEFPTLLRELLSKVSANGHYPASQTLQMIRLLKRYKLVRDQQMEFAFPTEALSGVSVAMIDAVEAATDDEDA